MFYHKGLGSVPRSSHYFNTQLQFKGDYSVFMSMFSSSLFLAVSSFKVIVTSLPGLHLISLFQPLIAKVNSTVNVHF